MGGNELILSPSHVGCSVSSAGFCFSVSVPKDRYGLETMSPQYPLTAPDLLSGTNTNTQQLELHDSVFMGHTITTAIIVESQSTHHDWTHSRGEQTLIGCLVEPLPHLKATPLSLHFTYWCLLMTPHWEKKSSWIL